jgi:hypothetical protein
MALLKRGSNWSVEASSALRAGDPVDGDAVTVVERPLPTARAGEDLHLMAKGAKHTRRLMQVGGYAAIGSIGRVLIKHKRDFHRFVSRSRQHAGIRVRATFQVRCPVAGGVTERAPSRRRLNRFSHATTGARSESKALRNRCNAARDPCDSTTSQSACLRAVHT